MFKLNVLTTVTTSFVAFLFQYFPYFLLSPLNIPKTSVHFATTFVRTPSRIISPCQHLTVWCVIDILTYYCKKRYVLKLKMCDLRKIIEFPPKSK